MNHTKKILLIPALVFSLLLTTVYANEQNSIGFPELALANTMKGFIWVP